jgi:hypothetical protein
MRTHLVRKGLAFLCLGLVSVAVYAAGPPTDARKTAKTETREGDRLDDVAQLARSIDRHISAGLEARKVVAAPLANDSEFVRRIYLDLAGRTPRVSEVRDFLDDRRPDKRRQLVEKLLSGPNYVNHLTNVWRALLLPNNNNPQVQFLAAQIQEWARVRVRNNVPYDKLARDLITATITGGFRRGPLAPGAAGDPGATAFYQVNEMKPDNLAAATSRLFLGVKIECAQCHDHPFAKWTRKQFWEYTAFFAGIKSTNPNAGIFAPATDDPTVHEITIPGSEKKVQARFLDGTVPEWKDDSQARRILADWMTRPDNPFFARTGANRLWEHFFGIGLVDPADDFREENPASHPELLDELAKGLITHKFDLKFLIRAITATQAYQRTSVMTHRSQDDLRSFARMPLKSLAPEQVFDSLATAVGYRGDATAVGFRAGLPGGNARNEIQTRFANPVDRRTEAQTSILQALALMNGKFISDATSLDRSETLGAVIDSPFMDTRQKLDTLFMAALARPMRGSEAGRLVSYVDSGGPSRNSKRALADVFWVLLNSSEFILNH